MSRNISFGGLVGNHSEALAARRERERALYATDPEYRARKIEQAKRYYQANREKRIAQVAARAATPEERAKERDRGNRRYQAWRARWVAELGGRCVVCGETEDLQFDHVDWREKSFNVAVRWRIKDESMAEEMRKCQLLCVTHHREKTVGDQRSRLRLGSRSSTSSSA